MNKDFVTFIDVNGKYVFVSQEEVNKTLSEQSLTIFGADLKAISQLIKQYYKKGGKVPITVETVKEIFGEKDSNTFCIHHKADPNNRFRYGPFKSIKDALIIDGEIGEEIWDVYTNGNIIVRFRWNVLAHCWDEIKFDNEFGGPDSDYAI